jgi:hypothetical protein
MNAELVIFDDLGHFSITFWQRRAWHWRLAVTAASAPASTGSDRYA